MHNETKNKIKEVLSSKVFRYAIRGLGFMILTCLIFQAGVFVGFHRASFGRDWGDNYERNFGPLHRGPKMMNFDFGNLPNAHGAVGKIIKIELPSIIVEDKDGTEKVILINDDTSIKSMREDLPKKDLKVGDFVVVIGSPNNNGQIESKLIRLMPAGMPDFPLGNIPAPKQ